MFSFVGVSRKQLCWENAREQWALSQFRVEQGTELQHLFCDLFRLHTLLLEPRFESLEGEGVHLRFSRSQSAGVLPIGEEVPVVIAVAHI